MILIVGQSAAGKDTLLGKILEKYENLNKIVTYTTRPPRDDEVQGYDYHFLTKEAFENLDSKGFFVCVSLINGWYYGFPRAETLISDDKIIVLNPAGMREIKQILPDCKVIYLKVNDRIRMIRQILRGDDISEIVRRYTFDAGQFLGMENEVDYIINDDVYEADVEKSMETYLKFFDEILNDIEAKKSSSQEETEENSEEKANNNLIH